MNTDLKTDDPLEPLTAWLDEINWCSAATSMDFEIHVIGKGKDFVTIIGRPTDDDMDDADCVQARVYDLGEVPVPADKPWTSPPPAPGAAPGINMHLIRVCHIRQHHIIDKIEEFDTVVMTQDACLLWAYIYAGN